MKRSNSTIIFIYLILANVLFAKLTETTVQLFGGAKQVSGSCYYFDTDEIDFLVDCGLFYPETKNMNYGRDVKNTNRLNTQPPVSPNGISAIIITHAHLDHIGKIPLLISKGFDGIIYSTELTKDLSLIMFEMLLKSTSLGDETFTKSSKSKKVHSQYNCKWKNKIKRPKYITLGRSELYDRNLQLCKECLSIEINNIERLFSTIPFNRKVKLSKNISLELFDAKHIPGSSSVLIDFDFRNSDKSVYITGDIGSGLDNILSGMPEKPKEVDFIFIESTYGGKSRDLPTNPFDTFYSDLDYSVRTNKFVWIPCFVLDRTQKVLNSIRRGQNQNKLPKNIDIKIVSSTAKKVNNVYDKHYNYRPKYVDESFSMSPMKLMEEIENPMILITPSYIDGIDFFHPIIQKIITNRNSEIMLVGYQDPRSVGGILKEIKKGSSVKLGYDYIDVSANVTYYGGIFSGHIDSNGIIDYLGSMTINNKIYLVHGDLSSLENLSGSLKPLFGNKVVIPSKGQTFLIK
jgi:metallo-beta-lactamase family protein|tara:strand:+ start:51 stop:1598 length:1548 start_codon:yes stop_codon:yes gene_type:complete